jgi:putative membrane-bound dehydrogenase-like protein
MWEIERPAELRWRGQVWWIDLMRQLSRLDGMKPNAAPRRTSVAASFWPCDFLWVRQGAVAGGGCEIGAWLVLAIVGLSGAMVQAQGFREPPDTEKDLKVVAMNPDEAAAGFQVPAGFEVKVVAAEPEVRNPIALSWDRRGRMWVAENFTYAEKAVRYDLSLRDRVLILEDADQDGVAETIKVFVDSVQRLTSVEIGRGGVWLMCPPQLLFVPDADGDDVPDGAPEVVLDGFEIGESSYHNLANGLRWGPDGWLYGRCGHSCPAQIGRPGTAAEERLPMKGGIWRYHPERQVAEVVLHGTTNPWGHDWDRHGEGFFINVVNGHLWHLIAGAHCKELFGAPLNPLVFERLDTIADHWHFDTTGKWSDSRDGAANHLGGGHAHVGMTIYQADQWPAAWQDRLLTLNLHGRRANVERLERLGSGFVGRHEPDTLVAADPWFRGTEIRTGPDGCVYVLDWSDTGECHEHTGVHRNSGRIYRVSHGQPEKVSYAALAAPLDWPAVDGLLAAKNVWWVAQLRERLSHEEGLEGLADPLEKRVRAAEAGAEARLRALWALERVWPEEAEARREALLLELMADKEEAIRVWAVRLLLDDWPLDRADGGARGADRFFPAEWERALVERAAVDESGLVRLTLASSLQRLPWAQRADLAAALISRREDALDPSLPLMVWYGVMPLVKTEPEALVRLAEGCRWPNLLRWCSRALAGQVKTQPAGLDGLLRRAAKTSPNLRAAVLQGMSEAFAGWRQAPALGGWAEVVAAVKAQPQVDEETANRVRDLSALFGDGRALDEVRRVVADDTADPEQRKAALMTLIEARPADLRALCERVLDVRGVNGIAVRGLAMFDDAKLGTVLAKRYRKFEVVDRPALMDALVSRPAWAKALLEQLAAGAVPRSDLSAFHARQMQALDDPAINQLLVQHWGELRESDAGKRAFIEKLRRELTPERLAEANLSDGRQTYQAVCAACHVLYGEGGAVGPDLTGSGRAQLDYLLENIVDPSAVVAADQRMTVVTLKDGRVLSGVIAAQSEQVLTLRALNDEQRIERREIVKQETSALSMMPEGLLNAMSSEQVRDLVAYLMHPKQVPLPTAVKRASP